MKVAVTGASGIQGMSAMIYLLEQGDVDRILATDNYNLERLEKRVEILSDDRLRTKKLDCTNEDASAAVFKGYDVVVNCAHIPGFYLNTTRGALRAGANYIDLGSSGQDREIFELSDEFRKRNRTAITSMGTAPGLSNVMAVYCMNKLDKVDSIDFMWGVVDIVPPEEHTRPLYWGYGFDGIMGLVSGKSLVYEDGELKQEEPRSRPEVYNFKPPVGPQMVAGFPHPEPRHLSESFPDMGIKHIMYRQAFDKDSEMKYRFLRDLGFANQTTPIDVMGTKVIPFQVLWALLEKLPPEQKRPVHTISEGNCIVRGLKDDGRVEVKLMIRTSPDSEMHRRYTSKGAFGSYRTGICGAMAGILCGRGLIKKKGVYRPELCVPPELYIGEQVKVGMEVEESTTHVL
jgi:lysine 6-dehydrogenase